MPPWEDVFTIEQVPNCPLQTLPCWIVLEFERNCRVTQSSSCVFHVFSITWSQFQFRNKYCKIPAKNCYPWRMYLELINHNKPCERFNRPYNFAGRPRHRQVGRTQVLGLEKKVIARNSIPNSRKGKIWESCVLFGGVRSILSKNGKKKSYDRNIRRFWMNLEFTMIDRIDFFDESMKAKDGKGRLELKLLKISYPSQDRNFLEPPNSRTEIVDADTVLDVVDVSRSSGSGKPIYFRHIMV